MTSREQDRTVLPAGLGEPPAGEPYAAIVQTHTSVVLFAGGLAYKLKKPVRLPFLDLSRWEDRLADCEAEVTLNRRIAPDVYLGVGRLPIPAGPGPRQAVPPAAPWGRESGPGAGEGEPVVVMRRMPAVRRLSRLITAGEDTAGPLQVVARQLAVMHSRQAPVRDFGLGPTMTSLWRAGREQLTPFEDDVLSAAALDDVIVLALEYLHGRSALLDARERAGHVRDGHGDLLADDIFCLDDGPRILDCLEFDPGLRIGDVLADAAFLAMDLHAHGRPDLAELFLHRYQAFTGEQAPRSLTEHYVAYRAFVRAKVECLRHLQGDPTACGHAAAMLDLCRRRLAAGRVHLVLTGGLPGSGKSTLARGLAEHDPLGREWALLSSDRVRKELAGLPATVPCAAPFRTGLYDPARTTQTYQELLHRAGSALHRGVSVVLDASWTEAGTRTAARELAASAGALLTEVECRAAADVCRRRLTRRRRPHPSDADAEVLARMAAHADPWPEAVPVDTDGPRGRAAAQVRTLLTRRATGPVPCPG